MSCMTPDTVSNTTVYDRAAIAEVAKALRFSGKKRPIISAAILCVIGLCLILSDEIIFGIAFPLGGVIGLILYFSLAGKRKKKIEDQLIAQIMTSYHEDEFSCDIVVDSVRVHSKTSISEKDVLHCDIKKVIDTGSYFLIFYNGGLWAIVDKNGFTDGTADDFLRLLGHPAR